MNLCNRMFVLIDTLEFEDFYELIDRWDRRADLEVTHAHNIAYMLRLAQEAESFLRMSALADKKEDADQHALRAAGRKTDIRNCYAGMVMKAGEATPSLRQAYAFEISAS